MRRLMRSKVLGGCLIAAIAAVVAVGAQQANRSTAERSEVTKAQADRWMTDLSNWNRWGKDDQLGALNLITAQKRQQAMALAKSGTVLSLERPVVLSPKPEDSKADNKPHGVSFYEIRFKTFHPATHAEMTDTPAICRNSMFTEA